MKCCICGLTAPALKTVRRGDGSGSEASVLCDSCYQPLAGKVWIVPGWSICWGTCRLCGVWVSVNDLEDPRLGGRHGAYSGMCPDCDDVRK